MGKTHDKTRINYRGTRVPIDKKIAPLMKEFWKTGARTWASCEDVGEINSDPDKLGTCLIIFVDATDAITFLNAATVFEEGGKSLYNRMSHCGCRAVFPWQYEITPYDRAYEEIDNEEIYFGPSDYGFSVKIRFPRSDIPAILENLASNRSGPKLDD